MERWFRLLGVNACGRTSWGWVHCLAAWPSWLPADRGPTLLPRPLLLTDPWVSNYNLKLGVAGIGDKSFSHKVLCDGGVSQEGVCPCA